MTSSFPPLVSLSLSATMGRLTTAAAAVGHIIRIWQPRVSRPSKCALSARGEREEGQRRRGQQIVRLLADLPDAAKAATSSSFASKAAPSLQQRASEAIVSPPFDILFRIIPSHRSLSLSR